MKELKGSRQRIIAQLREEVKREMVDEKLAELKLCKNCNTMKRFTTNICFRCLDRNEAREEVKDKIHADIQEIIKNAKATFFVTKGEKVEIPPDELLYELQAEISNQVSMYFIKLK